MKVVTSSIPDVLIIEPEVFSDRRGFFLESFNQQVFSRATGIDANFVQDNHSRSGRRVLRGLHFQVERPQGKLVRVVSGAILDVAVDLRRSSSTYSKWVAVELSAENHRQLWIPPHFAHGFLVLSDTADVLYKTTEYYAPQYERSLRWNDPTIGIEWPLDGEPLLSVKDRAAMLFPECELL